MSDLYEELCAKLPNTSRHEKLIMRETAKSIQARFDQALCEFESDGPGVFVSLRHAIEQLVKTLETKTLV